jgi:hypothetical protein
MEGQKKQTGGWIKMFEKQLFRERQERHLAVI